MTAAGIKRGFRRIAIACIGVSLACAALPLAGLVLTYTTGPYISCPEDFRSVHFKPETPDPTALATACEGPWAKFSRRVPAVSPDNSFAHLTPETRPTDYGRLATTATNEWRRQMSESAWIAGALAAAGVVGGALFELLSWIIRGFMRD